MRHGLTANLQRLSRPPRRLRHQRQSVRARDLYPHFRIGDHRRAWEWYVLALQYCTQSKASRTQWQRIPREIRNEKFEQTMVQANCLHFWFPLRGLYMGLDNRVHHLLLVPNLLCDSGNVVLRTSPRRECLVSWADRVVSRRNALNQTKVRSLVESRVETRSEAESDSADQPAENVVGKGSRKQRCTSETRWHRGGSDFAFVTRTS